MASVPVDSTAFAVFGMQALDEAGFDAGLASAGDQLAVVFFRGLDCFNCEIARKAMLAKPGEIRALGLKWFHSNVRAHRDPGRRFMLHGLPAWFFFSPGQAPRAVRSGSDGGARTNRRVAKKVIDRIACRVLKSKLTLLSCVQV